MQTSSACVQKAVFAALERDDLLLNGLSGRVEDTLPQLSFDAMTSEWRDRHQRLVGHRVQFSAWGHLAGFADLAALSERLQNQLADIDVAPLHLVRVRLLLLESRLDTPARLWRQQISFEIVTQSGEEASS